jgi:F-type H+-transporting ATPase subunit delta
MSIRKVARRYAGALVDLTLEKGQQAEVKEELRALSALMQQAPQLPAVFAHPAIGKLPKERVLQSVIDRTRPSQLTANFLRLLLKNERLHHLGEIFAAFQEELDHRLGITNADVATARPLTEDEQRQLTAQLEKLTGKQVRLRAETNPDVIGGVVVRIGSEIFDGSLRTQLENLRKQLSQ